MRKRRVAVILPRPRESGLAVYCARCEALTADIAGPAIYCADCGHPKIPEHSGETLRLADFTEDE